MSEESNLSPPQLIVSEPIQKSETLIVKRPNPYIYVLIQDGDHICFSPSIKGLRKIIDLRVSLLGVNYIGQNLSIDDYTKAPVGYNSTCSNFSTNTTINVYAEYTNFLFHYFRIVSEFEILRIPHYRFELAKSTRNSTMGE